MRRARPESSDESAEDAVPSKSSRKRDALAAQALGEQLISLPETELAALELPEELLTALEQARRIKSRAAGSRQRQYIGKLMRDIDLTRIAERLAARSEQSWREAELFKRVEAWRERLISEPQALAELAGLRPGLDEQHLARQIAAARRERAERGQVGNAGRELFRAVRALFDTMPQ
jgi:ribosome-associated protein